MPGATKQALVYVMSDGGVGNVGGQGMDSDSPFFNRRREKKKKKMMEE